MKFFRVSFYVDTDYSVQGFAETVQAADDGSGAFTKAVAQARKAGYGDVRADEWQNATEIDCFEFQGEVITHPVPPADREALLAIARRALAVFDAGTGGPSQARLRAFGDLGDALVAYNGAPLAYRGRLNPDAPIYVSLSVNNPN